MPPDRHRLLHLLEIVTVGFPFCTYKILTGSFLLGLPGWGVAGGTLVVLGTLDATLNLVSFALTLAGRGSGLAVCTFQQVLGMLRGGHHAWRELGLSIDAMFAFSLVALMIGLGLLAQLPPHARGLWNTCVVLNVLGAGIGRLAESLAALRESEPGPTTV